MSRPEHWDRAQRMIISLATLGQMLCVVGCTNNSKHSGGDGSIDVAIFQPNNAIFDDRLTFEVRVPQGLAQKIENHASKIGDFPHDTNCSEQIRVKSPDQALVAGCAAGSHDVFFVRDSRTGSTIFQAKLSYSKIEGITWAPDSSAVAVLTTTSYTSIDPKYWFAAMSGHPVQFEKYRLEILDPHSLSQYEIDIPYESSLGYGRVGTWSKSR